MGKSAPEVVRTVRPLRPSAVGNHPLVTAPGQRTEVFSFLAHSHTDAPIPGAQDSVGSRRQASETGGSKFFEIAKQAAKESGGDFNNTYSRSKTLREMSQRSTASHTIPKVHGEVRAARVCMSARCV